ncbi:DUF169 domain-containing protein [Desulfovirgula thermocuniculi]|uniref:DUF169 domain-containing protein n=1 Tax=Desulfovirgula thermocuniculi TaxID=348842 RepID=UPI000400887E|nr:DUF169 domain-containing protein [Desulfovirgula thermocuniculi]
MALDPQTASARLEEYLRPATFPVAVKLSGEEDLPPKARRPVAALGHPLCICQGISLARYLGWTMGFLKEDHACAPSLVVLGLAEEPPDLKMSAVVQPLYGETAEACELTHRHMARLPLGKIKSVWLAPLGRAAFEPDVVLVYGSPAQVARLIHSALYKKGGAITSTFIGRNSCAAALAAPYLQQQCQVVVPGSGERIFAHTQDHEMCFAFPWSLAEEVLYGLEATHRAGAMRFPTPFLGMRQRPLFPPSYHPLEERFGLR